MALGRTYTAIFENVTVTAQQDFFEINAPATAVVILKEIHLSQNTEVGDAQEEMLRIAVKSGATTSGTGGTTPTAIPLELGDAAFGGTVEVNNTTKATAGTIVTHYVYSWNERVPLDIVFTPETCKPLSPSGRLTVELLTTPGDTMNISGYVIFDSIGG